MGRHAELAPLVTPSDGAGHQPLPKRLAEACLKLDPSMTQHGSELQMELKARPESKSLLTQSVQREL